jgi:hypothetical protein
MIRSHVRHHFWSGESVLEMAAAAATAKIPGSDVAGIVLDLGTVLTRCGIAGEGTPQVLIPTVLQTPRGVQVCHVM